MSSSRGEALDALASFVGDILERRQASVLQVPFYAVPELVRRRSVELQEGMAIITTPLQLKLCLRQLFEQALLFSIDQSDVSDYGHQEDDRRMDGVLKAATRHFDHSVLTRSSSVRARLPPLAWDQVHNMSAKFPPCFAALHARLECRRRVGHHARVAYTLFLKEIGMGFDQAVAFWEHHYSKPHSSTSSRCSHSWQVDQSRYVYSIKGQ